MPKKKPIKGKPDVHSDLKGFNIKINEFGEITTNLKVDKLNEFLNKNLEDKKLKNQTEEVPLEEETDTEDDDATFLDSDDDIDLKDLKA